MVNLTKLETVPDRSSNQDFNPLWGQVVLFFKLNNYEKKIQKKI